MFRTKYIVVVILVLLAIAGGVGWYQYSRGHESMSDTEADVVISARSLAEAFASDEAAANTRYLNQSVAVKGKLIQVEKTEGGVVNLILEGAAMSNVVCELDKRYTGDLPALNEEVTVQGICTGNLMDIILVRCVPK